MNRRIRSFAWVVAFVIVVAAVIGEGYARFLVPGGKINPEILKARHFKTNLQYVPSLFSRHLLAPQKHSVYFSSADSFRFELEDGFENIVKWPINSHGYRGKEFSAEKPPGTTRILIYGGSFVFDIRTAGDMDWPSQAESVLRERGHKVEILNAGIPGHMSFDALGRFFTEGHRFDPDYVVLCNKWNDLKYFINDDPLSHQFLPYSPRPNPRFEYQGTFDRWLCGLSQLYCRARNLYWPAPRRYEAVLQDSPPPPESSYTAVAIDASLRQYRLHFEMFVDAARHLGVTPILMTQPLLIARDNTPEARAVIEYEKVLLSHERLCEATERADEEVRDVARASGATLIDASASHVSGRLEYFTDQVHLTREGSVEFARVVADALEEVLR